MAIDLIQFAFVSGEISETFFGRADLEKYDLGLASVRNWFVDYRGGLSTRPGQFFSDVVVPGPSRLVPFKFGTQSEDVFVLLFGHQYVRFLQNGRYVLEAAKTVTGVTDGVVAAVAHGFAVGDLVRFTGLTSQLGNRTVLVASTTADTFTVTDVYGTAITFSTTLTGTVARVYTVPTGYAGADLPQLYFTQIRDYLRITSHAYPTNDLIRNDTANWQFRAVTIGGDLGVPPAPTGVTSTAGSYAYIYQVTALFPDGSESLASDPLFLLNSANMGAENASITLTWNTVLGATRYNIYRSIPIAQGANPSRRVSRGHQMGYVGTSYGGNFTDTNILPDFTKAPPVRRNPFANNGIERIDVTAKGVNFTNSSVVTITDPTGTGFAGYPVVDDSGGLAAIIILRSGSNYTNPVVSVSGGSGATFTVKRTPATGNNPKLSTLFQQRLVYLNTINSPIGLWGSKPGQLENFDEGFVVADNDAYEFELFVNQVTPINASVATRGGLLLMTQNNILLLSGTNGGTVTPSDVISDPHSYTGCSELQPLTVDSDIIYVEGRGYTVRLLSYNDFSKVYTGMDLSILSNHLFGPTKRIVSWDYAQDPFKLVYAVRSDGTMLTFTIVKDQDVFAWTRNTTRGFYRDVTVINENGKDRVYFLVERFINNRWVTYIEYQATRDFRKVEDSVCLDAAIQAPLTYPDATLNISLNGTAAGLVASSGVFSSGDVGKFIRAAGGRVRITGYGSPTYVTGTIELPFLDTVPESPTPRVYPVPAGEWSLASMVRTIYGLWHLEGQDVSAVLDGTPISGLTVRNGSVTLPASASLITIGIPYRCIAQNLPIIYDQNVTEHRRKRVVGIGMRLHESSGLSAGPTLDDLNELKERQAEPWGEAVALKSGMRFLNVTPVWDEISSSYFVQDNPLPATLLGFVLQTEVGDD